MEILCLLWCCDWRGKRTGWIFILLQYCRSIQLTSWWYIYHGNLNLKITSFPLQCDPYFDNEGCSHPGCEPGYPTPKCLRKCVKGNLLWKQAKHYSKIPHKIKSDPYDIMAEVYKNGPVQVSFTVYEVKEKQMDANSDPFYLKFFFYPHVLVMAFAFYSNAWFVIRRQRGFIYLELNVKEFPELGEQLICSFCC